MISVFEYIEKNKDEGLFVRSARFLPYVRELAKKYNSFLEKDDKENYSFFLIDENASIKEVINRVIALIIKYLGKETFEELYLKVVEDFLFFREISAKKGVDVFKIDETIKKALLEKNVSLLTKGSFKVEEILFEEIEKEKNDNEKNEDYWIKGKIIVILKDGKPFKSFPSFVTVSEKEKPFLDTGIEHNGKYYYLGDYSFGEKIDLKELEKDILLKLIKKVKGENDD